MFVPFDPLSPFCPPPHLCLWQPSICSLYLCVIYIFVSITQMFILSSKNKDNSFVMIDKENSCKALDIWRHSINDNYRNGLMSMQSGQSIGLQAQKGSMFCCHYLESLNNLIDEFRTCVLSVMF